MGTPRWREPEGSGASRPVGGVCAPYPGMDRWIDSTPSSFPGRPSALPSANVPVRIGAFNDAATPLPRATFDTRRIDSDTSPARGTKEAASARLRLIHGMERSCSLAPTRRCHRAGRRNKCCIVTATMVHRCWRQSEGASVGGSPVRSVRVDTFARRPRGPQQTPSIMAAVATREQASQPPEISRILRLQLLAGNRAVIQMLRARLADGAPSNSTVSMPVQRRTSAADRRRRSRATTLKLRRRTLADCSMPSSHSRSNT
jgi:hypothetical protein